MLRELGDARPHRLDDPPAAAEGAQGNRDIAADRDPVRDVELAREIAGRIEQDRDDPHRLLGVVEAVADRVSGRGDEVEGAELPFGTAGARPARRPACDEHDQHRQHHSEHRRQDDRDQGLVEPRPLDSGQPGMGHSGPDQAADEGMAGRGGDALQPGDDVPEHRSDQGSEDHGGCDQILVDQPLADRVRDLVKLRYGESQEIGREVEEGGEDDRLHRAEQPGRDHGRDRVGGVVEPVQEVERQSDGDEADEQRQGQLVHVLALLRRGR